MDWRFSHVPASGVRPVSPLLTRKFPLVVAYAALLHHGVSLPPLVARRCGTLREGYQLLRAHTVVGSSVVRLIEFSSPSSASHAHVAGLGVTPTPRVYGVGLRRGG